MLFALVEILGEDPALLSLYDASLSEWAADDAYPMVCPTDDDHP